MFERFPPRTVDTHDAYHWFCKIGPHLQWTGREFQFHYWKWVNPKNNTNPPNFVDFCAYYNLTLTSAE